MDDRALIADIRFGFGLSDAAKSRDGLLSQLQGPDQAALEFPSFDMKAAYGLFNSYRKARREERSGSAEAAMTAKVARQKALLEIGKAHRAIMARAVFTKTPFRERLVHFWMDHFTVAAKNLPTLVTIPPMIDEAIRPHISGKFVDLLEAADLHPAMLIYLDQQNSIGPNSPVGKRRGRGLNENLARELLELHTLGVGAGYTQGDVRELAKLLTGIRYLPKRGVIHAKNQTEPGPKVILGNTYGQGRADIRTFLEDVSLHPDTARHLARKLAIHFVGGEPDPEFVEQMADAYLRSDGDLSATYAAMLDHPAAWGAMGAKVKPPFEYIASGLRAAGVTRAAMMGDDMRNYRDLVLRPMQLMGQEFGRAPGPDGWPEEAEAWVTPSALAGRLQWALQVARLIAPRTDPRAFIDHALGVGRASEALRFAAHKSQSKEEAIAMILASPEFNRR